MPEETVEITDRLAGIAQFAFDEAIEQLDSGEELDLFVVIIKGEDLYVESFAEGEVDEVYNYARAELARESAEIDAYALCYDGYLETDEGEVDAIIVEAAEKGDDEGHALGLVYRVDDAAIEFEEAPVYLDTVPSILVR